MLILAPEAKKVQYPASAVMYAGYRQFQPHCVGLAVERLGSASVTARPDLEMVAES